MAALTIDDAEAQALAGELARLERKTVEQVVKEALREKLIREQDKRGHLVERLMQLGAIGAAAPVLDPRSPDEIIGYDEFGVPS